MSSEPDIEAQHQEPQLDFQQLVRTLLVIRQWLLHTRQRLNDKKAEENIDHVFGPTGNDVNETPEKKTFRSRISNCSFDDTSYFFYIWTFIVVVGCGFNLVMIVIMVFEEVHEHFYREWIIMNLCFDGIFFLDFLVLMRRQFVENGVRFTSTKDMFKHRVRTKQFILDVLCILPTDVLLMLKSNLSLSRINRLCKCYRIGEFNALTEIRTNSPNLFRVLKLLFTCFVIFHWNGCLYFFLGVLYNFKNAVYNDWIFSYDKIPNPIVVTCDIHNHYSVDYCDASVIQPLRIYAENANVTMEVEKAMNYWQNRSRSVAFSNFTKQYGLSFYWSALTLVTLGEQPWPNDTFQNSFEIGDTLLGLVIFAVIVGDVGNMVSNMNLKRSEFEDDLDGCKRFMTYRKVPSMLQKKAVEYFAYMWGHGGAQVDEEQISEFLPPRLYGQLAVYIHMETLRKVKLFQDCEPSLLFELILKLEPRVYSPSDYVCKKGEVGTEMFIVKQGAVEVVNEDGTKVFVQLGEGTVFGELSVLNIPGNKNGNRRTANVRSVGYSDLYVLSKEALWEALREYPDAAASLMEKGKELLAKDNLLDESAVEEDQFDPDAPVDLQLQMVQDAVFAFEKQLERAEMQIRGYGDRTKRRLKLIEEEMSEELEWLQKQAADTEYAEVSNIVV